MRGLWKCNCRPSDAAEDASEHGRVQPRAAAGCFLPRGRGWSLWQWPWLAGGARHLSASCRSRGLFSCMLGGSIHPLKPGAAHVVLLRSLWRALTAHVWEPAHIPVPTHRPCGPCLLLASRSCAFFAPASPQAHSQPCPLSRSLFSCSKDLKACGGTLGFQGIVSW